MAEIRASMTVLIAIAAFSRLMEMFAGDESSSGISVICGMCAAGCVLNAFASLINSIG